MSNPQPSHSKTGFRLSASLPKEVIKADQPVWVKALFENVSGHELPYGARAKFYDYHLECRTEQGELVPLTRYGQRMAGNRGMGRYITSTLPPGEKLVNDILVSQQVDVTLAGKYTLKVTREVFPGEGGDQEPVASNTCSFEVIED